jgi:hypothetical protein
MTPIAVKDFGIDPISTLTQQVWVWQLTIDAKSEVVIVVYDEVLVASNGNLVKVVKTDSYKRFNKAEVFYSIGDIITPAVLDGDNNIVTPAIIADGTEIKTPSAPKFDNLRNSQVGAAIAGMIAQDLTLALSVETLNADLTEN